MALVYGISSGMRSGAIPNVGAVYSTQDVHRKVPWGVLNVLTYIGEIGLSLLPGVGTAAVVGIALGGAVARFGIAIGENQLNALTEVIDFGSAFLPGLDEGIRALRFGKSLTNEVTPKFLNKLTEINRNDLEARGAAMDAKQYEALQTWGQRKLDYDTKTQLYYQRYIANYEKNARASFVTVSKWYEKMLIKARATGDRQLKLYLGNLKRYLDAIDPTKHIKRFRKLNELLDFYRNIAVKYGKKGIMYKNRAVIAREEYGVSRAQIEFARAYGDLVGKLSRSGFGRLTGYSDFQRITGVSPDAWTAKYGRSVRNNWSYEMRSGSAFNRNALRKVNYLDGPMRFRDEVPRAPGVPKRASDRVITSQVGQLGLRYRYQVENQVGKRVFDVRHLDWLEREDAPRRYLNFGYTVRKHYPLLESQMGEELKSMWSQYIINPLSDAVNGLNIGTEVQKFMDLILKDPNEPYATKIRSITNAYKKRSNKLLHRLKHNLKSESQFIDSIGRSRGFKGGVEYSPTKTLQRQLDAYNEIAKKTLQENEIIETIARKLVDIKPSFKTNKGYLLNRIETELDSLKIVNNATATKVSQFLFVSTRKKERQLSFLIYKYALKRFINGQSDNVAKGLVLTVFQQLGILSGERVKKLFEQVSGLVGEQLEIPDQEFAREAFNNGLQYYSGRNNFIHYSRKWHLGSSSQFRYKTFKIGKTEIKLSRFRTWLNPMTIARAVPDSLYQTLRRFLDNKLDRQMSEHMTEIKEKFDVMHAERNALGVESKEARAEDMMSSTGLTADELLAEDKVAIEEFAKSGGMLLPSNRYLVGIKKIPVPDIEPGNNLLLFYFDKIFTRAKNPGFKNSEGKANVFGYATDLDVEMLMTEGVSYYWTHGLEKGWYVSRGGRSRGPHLLGEAGAEMSMFLGVLPINAIRNVLTLITSSEYELGRWANGRNEAHLGAKMKSTMIRTILNRFGRLVARYPVSSIGGKSLRLFGVSDERSRLLGRAVIGKEFQRYMSATLALTVRSNYRGQLKIGLPSTSKIEHKYLLASLASFKRQGFTRTRAVGPLGPRTLDPYKNRFTQIQKYNRYRTSGIRQILGAQRKLGYVRRVTGLYPRSLPGGYRIGRIKLR